MGHTWGMRSPLQSPGGVGGDLSGQSAQMRPLGKSWAEKLGAGMKLLGVYVSSILSPGERGRGERCLRGARNRRGFKQNLLSVSVENLRCTLACRDPSAHKRSRFSCMAFGVLVTHSSGNYLSAFGPEAEPLGARAACSSSAKA